MANEKLLSLTSKADIEEIHRLAALGESIEQIAQTMGVSHQTIYNRWKDTPAIAEAIETGRRKARQAVEDKLYQQAIDGNTTAIIFWLKCRAKEQWSDRQQLDLTTNGGPVQLTIINDLKE